MKRFFAFTKAESLADFRRRNLFLADQQAGIRVLRNAFDFLQPDGEPALVPPTSISWRVFKNPVSLFVGGVAAVLMEFAVPGVRSGVWDHSSFRDRPVERLQRTGLAAMVTVYGAESRARKVIAHVVRKHDMITGTTEQGERYS